MGKFITKILCLAFIAALPFLYPSYKYLIGACYGDIYSLSAKTFTPEYRSLYCYEPGFPLHPLITEDYPAVASDSDVFIIGDSFSQQGTTSFMDYLQNEMPDHRVVNVQQGSLGDDWRYIHKSMEEKSVRRLVFKAMTDFLVYMLEYSPVLPKTIIMESTEWFMVDRFAEMRFHVSDAELEDFDEGSGIFLQPAIHANPWVPRPKDSFMDEMGEALVTAQKWIKKHVGIDNRVCSMKLSRKMFTCEGDEDVSYFQNSVFKTYTKPGLAEAVANQQKLIALAKEKGVNLIFMFAPDKMMLYRKFAAQIKDRERLTGWLESMATMPSKEYGTLANDPHYQLNIDIFGKALDEGMMDLYPASDLHWSYKGADLSAKGLKNRILELEKR